MMLSLRLLAPLPVWVVALALLVRPRASLERLRIV
jgi:hypothetical protein